MDPRYCGARRVSVDRIDRDILQRERLIMNLYRNNFSTSVQYYDVMRHWNSCFTASRSRKKIKTKIAEAHYFN